MGKRIIIMTLLLGTLILSTISCTKFPPRTKDAVLENNLIFEDTHLFPFCHASTVVETTAGNILIAFFGGTNEGTDDTCIWLCRKRGKGKWSTPQKVADGVLDGKKYPCWNPVLFQVPDGNLLLFYKIGTNPKSWVGAVLKSSDGGETWSTPEMLPNGFLGPTKNKPIISGGKIVCPSSTEGKRWLVHTEITDFSLSQWQKSEDINRRGELNLIQPTLIPMNDTVARAFFRSKDVMGPVFSSISTDAGKTWSDPSPIELPSNNSGIDGLVTADGMMLLAFNNGLGGLRSPLSLFSSFDGLKWRPFLPLESGNGEFSYPSIIQGRDGIVHLSFTYKRRRIKYLSIDINKIMTL